MITIEPEQTADLPPATYPVRLGITTADQETTVWVPLCRLRILPAPGTRPARPVYCSYDDLRIHAGAWLDALYSGGEATQAGAAEERAEARAAFDEMLVARGGGGSIGPGSRAAWLESLLDADGLIVSEPVRRWNVLWSLHLVCRRQITTRAANENPYRALAADYKAEADALLPTLAPEIDTGGDGVGDVVIPMGTLRIYRG